MVAGIICGYLAVGIGIFFLTVFEDKRQSYLNLTIHQAVDSWVDSPLGIFFAILIVLFWPIVAVGFLFKYIILLISKLIFNWIPELIKSARGFKK